MRGTHLRSTLQRRPWLLTPWYFVFFAVWLRVTEGHSWGFCAVWAAVVAVLTALFSTIFLRIYARFARP